MEAAIRHGPFVKALISSLEAIEERASGQGQKPLSTGVPDLDEFVGEMRPGELIVIAGRPGHGKTSLLNTVARNVALRQNRRIALLQLEGSDEATATRLLAMESRVSIRSLQTGGVADEQWTRMASAIKRLAEAPIHISTDPFNSVSDLAEFLWGIKNSNDDLSAVFIDGPSLLPILCTGQSRRAYLAEMIYDLKRLARELEAPILITGNIKSEVENRINKRPFLTDLADTSAMEVAADVVLAMYRDELYEPGTHAGGEVEILVIKNRLGALGHVHAAFLSHLGLIAGFAREAQPA